MDMMVKESLDECIRLSSHLLSLQDEDATRMRVYMRGEQQHRYQNIMYIEREKLEQLKSGLQSLQDAQSFL